MERSKKNWKISILANCNCKKNSKRKYQLKTKQGKKEKSAERRKKLIRLKKKKEIRMWRSLKWLQLRSLLLGI